MTAHVMVDDKRAKSPMSVDMVSPVETKPAMVTARLNRSDVSQNIPRLV